MYLHELWTAFSLFVTKSGTKPKQLFYFKKTGIETRTDKFKRFQLLSEMKPLNIIIFIQQSTKLPKVALFKLLKSG